MNNEGNCVPKLSRKELLALRDQLDTEQLAIKKFQQYETDLSDPELKKLCCEMVKTHRNHYNTLIKHLNC